jgi:hypothetical protein
MLDVLLQRSTVVSLAVIGGILSVCVTVLSARGALSEVVLKRLNMASYVFMGMSMVLFIVAGLS